MFDLMNEINELEQSININTLFESEFKKTDIPTKKETCGIKREDMPQVAEKDHVHLKRFLTKNKVGYKEFKTDPETLKPTQSEFNMDKVNKLIDDFDSIKNKKILVSKDGRVIDGHHRWLAAKKKGERIGIIKINKRYDNVLDVLSDFSKTFSKTIHEDKDVE